MFEIFHFGYISKSKANFIKKGNSNMKIYKKAGVWVIRKRVANI